MKRGKRQPAELYGPLVPGWEIRWEGQGGTTTTGRLEYVRSTIAYYAREGRDMSRCVVTRTETCPAPGCDGDGVRKVRKRGHIFLAEIPCVGCRGRHETIENVSALLPLATIACRAIADVPLNEVLAELGYTTEPAEYGAKVILRNGVPVSRGTAGAVWLWLRESGQIL